MDEDTFWDLIEMLDWSKTGIDELVVHPLLKSLAAMPEQDIRGFFEFLARALYLLDTRAHWQAWGEESGDGFLYQRLCVVANGYDFYARVLRNPTSFDGEYEFESLLYVADKAYLGAAGKPFDRASTLPYESFSNVAEWGRCDA